MYTRVFGSLLALVMGLTYLTACTTTEPAPDTTSTPASTPPPASPRTPAPSTADTKLAQFLETLPDARFGNGVDWVAALRQDAISPRASVEGQAEPMVIEMDIPIPAVNITSMPDVIFSHKVHTEWLTCVSCHSGLFEMQRGASDITMTKITQGKSCGVCHGTVAFPVRACKRCHRTSES